jgi:hypothetical protein
MEAPAGRIRKQSICQVELGDWARKPGLTLRFESVSVGRLSIVRFKGAGLLEFLSQGLVQSLGSGLVKIGGSNCPDLTTLAASIRDNFAVLNCGLLHGFLDRVQFIGQPFDWWT